MKVTLITDNNGHIIGIVDYNRLATATASIEKDTDLTSLDFTCITFNLNELKPMHKVHVITKAESLEETPWTLNKLL